MNYVISRLSSRIPGDILHKAYIRDTEGGSLENCGRIGIRLTTLRKVLSSFFIFCERNWSRMSDQLLLSVNVLQDKVSPFIVLETSVEIYTHVRDQESS